jgi:hypothetical protein
LQQNIRSVTDKTCVPRTYVDITHDMPLAAAEAFSTLHPDSPFTFVHVSGEGATQTPSMFTPIFGRVKGQIETALVDLSKQRTNFHVYNVRPGGVDWSAQPEIHAFIPPQPAWKRSMLAPLNVVWKGMMTPTRPMGRVFTELAMSKGERLEGSGIEMDGTLLRNEAIRRLSGL